MGSAIAQELVRLLDGEAVIPVSESDYEDYLHADRWLFCAGAIFPMRGFRQSEDQVLTSMRVNLFTPMRMIGRILGANPVARICVIGSESGYSGSFDDTYAAAKSALHAYIERTPLLPDQQLVGIAPSIIEDAGMTLRREDQDHLRQRRAGHPKRRFLRAAEVARLAHFLLYADQGYISGTVVRMHGGEPNGGRQVRLTTATRVLVDADG